MRKLFAMLLALCMMCSAMTVMAEAPQLQPSQIGPAVFQIIPELTSEIIPVTDGCWRGIYSCPEYQMEISVLDYQTAGIPLDGTTGDNQFDNMYWMLRLIIGLEGAQAVNVANQAPHVQDFQLYGDDLMYLPYDDLSVCTYYCHNIGFIITTLRTAEDFSSDKLLEITLDTAKTFILDGATEDDMIAYVAEDLRIAEEIAAAEAAAEAEAEALRNSIIGYITITDGANIRTAPDGSATKIKTAYPGETYPLLGEEGTWYKILVDDEVAYVVKGLAKVN